MVNSVFLTTDPLSWVEEGMSKDTYIKDIEGELVPYSDYLEELRELGHDPRQYDHENYHCLRHRDAYRDKAAVYIKKATLTDPLRIEEIRWKAFQNYESHFVRNELLSAEIRSAPDKECFIPVDWDDLNKTIKKYKEDNEPLSEEDIERYSHPRRVASIEGISGEQWTSYDDNFWEYREPKHAGTDMEVIAAAAHLGEWEQIFKPARVKRSEDPAKVDLGRRWKHEERRGTALREKCYLLNEMLSVSILLSTVLPKGPIRHQKLVWVTLNGRRYPFNVGRGYNTAEDKLWPVSGDYNEITIVGKIELKKGR